MRIGECLMERQAGSMKLAKWKEYCKMEGKDRACRKTEGGDLQSFRLV